MASLQHTWNIIWIKTKLFCVAATILKIKNLNIGPKFSFWFDARFPSVELWVLTNGTFFVEASLI